MATVHREPNQVKWIGVRPGHNGEQVLVAIDTAVNVVVYTVAADTLLFLYDWHYGGNRNLAFGSILQIFDDGDNVNATIGYITSDASNPGTNMAQNLWVPIELVEGWYIKAITTQQVHGYIHGILIDV